MSSTQKIIIVGHLGHGPSSRALPSGDQVTNVSVATSETWKDKNTGAKQERTTWFNVSFWGRLADVAAQYLEKGSLVYIEGTVTARAYEGRDGKPGASLEVRARELKMLSSGRRDRDEEDERDDRPAPAARETQQQAPAQQTAPARDEFDDDIPF